MAFGQGTFQAAGGAVSDIFQGEATAKGLRLRAQGNLAEATNYDLAQTLAHDNAEFTKQSTEIKLAQAERQAYLGIGATESDVAGSGFAASGSALDLMRSGQQQAALTEAVTSQQGLLQEYSYNVQSDSYRNMAAAARSAAQTQQDMADDAIRNSYITAGLKAAGGITGLFI